MMKDPRVLQLQTDLKTLGYDPGPLDGDEGPKTRAAFSEYLRERNLMAATNAKIHEEAEQLRAPNALPEIVRIQGNEENLKNKLRDFTQAQYIQVHQTDFWAGDNPKTIERIKTNLYVSTEQVYEVHAHDKIVDGNYSDFFHIEVSWVSESRKVVTEKGHTFTREAGVWTPERETLLERAIVYAVQGFRAEGIEPVLITHRQTYKNRVIDPDLEIAQATYRIAKKHGFKLDFDWVRGSGRSAALWYPAGCGKLEVGRGVL